MPADLVSIIVIAFGLSADCFAVALGGSSSGKKISLAGIARVSFAFGLFQSLACLIGWAVGSIVVDFISAFDHWVAFGLLVIVGGHMLWESFHEEKEESERTDITRGLVLVTLAVATSLDSLAIGLSFAFLDMNIILAAGIIGLTSLAVTAFGFIIGRKAGSLLGRWAEVAGGIVLIGIGVRILVSHLI